MLKPGLRLGPYEVVAPLGAGGMGEVYRARDTRLGRDVAVKVLPARLAGNADALARFEREAKTVAALSHPNILAIHDVGVEGGIAFSVTELLEGQTLRDRLARSPLPWRRAAEIGAAVADGLAAAHARGLVHRDLKPENIFLTDDGRVKILDFGLARGVEAPGVSADAHTRAAALTEEGTVVGTPGYMSPEQVRGQPLDARSDVFSLGCVLHEMVTGGRAFAGATAADTMAAVLNHEPPDRLHTGVAIPPDVDRILAHCLEKNPQARFHSAHDIAFALKAALSDSGSARAGAVTPGRRTRTARVAVAVVVLIAAAGAIAWLAGIGGARRASSGALAPVRSIAVLPFSYAAGDHDAEFLSYAVTLSLSNSLAQVRDLEVRPHSSVSQFAGQAATDAVAVGKKLQVQTVLTGSIQTRKDDLLIACELVDVDTNRVRWGQVFNRKQADLVAVQQELARTIASELKVGLTGAEQSRVARRQTDDRKALELFVLGRREWNKYTEAGFRKSIDYYEQALQRDPAFALAYSGLADSYNQFATVAMAPSDALARAKEYADKALALDPSLAEAYVSLGTYHLFYDHDWAAAKKALDEAIAHSPNYPDTYHFLSHYWQAMEKTDEAVKAMEQAVKLDPTSLVINTELGFAFYFARRYDEAVRQYQLVLALDPGFTFSLCELSTNLAVTGRYREALQYAEKAAAVDPRDSYSQLTLAYVYAVAGRRDDAHRALARVEANEPRQFGNPFLQAAVLTALGEKDAAMRKLEEARDRHDPNLFLLRVDPKFDPLRSDPRFQKLVRQLWP